ncbi:MAG: outer membrane lipoprotein-sorting protein [Myxococcota bacterium]
MFKLKYVYPIIFIFIYFVPQVEAKKWGKCSWNTKKIVDKADRIMFAKTTAGKMVMKVKKSDYSSTIKMKFYSKGRDKMSVKIYSPSRLKGMSTLKVNNKVWYYMPRTDRIVKVNSSMMSSSWMGSHVTNDDLVKETQLQKHYTCHSSKSDKTFHVVTLKPKPSAPVVWGKIVMKIRKQDNIPVSSKYYSEKNKLERTMKFSDIREIDGRKIPAKMRLSPAGKNEYTEIYYKKIRFNVSIPGRYFTIRGLKR